MECNANINTIKQLIYLASCAVTEKKPDANLLKDIDLARLYQMSERHMLTACVAYALISAGIENADFQNALARAKRKAVLLEADKTALFSAMESRQIWYMPLKGMIIKGYYPRFAMREMADYDILFDADRANEVREIMESLGFETVFFNQGTHDVYHKMPVSNFEMHRALFGKQHDDRFCAYYQDVRRLLVRDATGDEADQFSTGYAYHMRTEDFYVFMMAHEHKHFAGSGTGLRSLLDTYVFWNQFEGQLDEDYIAAQLDDLGIRAFEEKNRQLAKHVFEMQPLTSEEEEILRYFVSSGTYGTIANRVSNQVEKYGGGTAGKMKYLMHRTFPSVREHMEAHPVLKQCRVLIPFYMIWRIGKGLTVKRGMVKREMQVLRESREKKENVR